MAFSCSKEYSSDEYGGYEMLTDYMLKEYQQGAALRTISASGVYQFYSPGTSVWTATLEPHDAGNGTLTQSVDWYISLNGGAETLYRTISRSDMYDGPVGLPRFDASLSLPAAIAALGNPSYSGNDSITFRFVLNLTDGRSFSTESVSGSLTQSYFRSPFQYTMVIGCFLDAGTVTAVPGIYTINGQDSWGDGWNGGVLTFTVDGTATDFTFTSGTDASIVVTVPESASTMSVSWSAGSWDSEVTYQVNYTNLSGGNAQVALSDGTSPAAGFKSLNICQ